ncbi:beta-hexosaminidase subunit alpha-like isoform X1 [Bradysia coprophila]|uniref:beta-hexosaminidase subunit alpha-like isoform X1 n=1 Tax=Bradysia coprophila TaxID=38358 RepID=UPI00187DCDCC|nr:beta-hexosaminidase subunit alpha-like isoform X1 [Bradysia coprophila]XP_037046118.1 beta-hexosaminidase subunit alpha-like isoform X1 [Bradysia coprophila]XP_037046128.1 beta-hexosaminidase subunit alpha-like isoform X1 [Bradysia coprophila]XP_037046138.1 beta-hexosaminidase subunit alpha-like isoform X1 [Bradysia coprophila]
MNNLLLIAILGSVIEFGHGTLIPIAPGSPLAGRKWPPGSVWPLPFAQVTTEKQLTFDPQSFKFATVLSTDISNCDPLEFAIAKYNNQFLFRTVEGITPIPDPNFKIISVVNVNITGGVTGENECLNYPRLSDNPSVYESYNLTIEEEGVGTIVAETVWGALRGIETFSQLIWNNDGYDADKGPLYFYINATSINDFPRFSHRGFMIDSARHYQLESTFYTIMDGMMYNKLNVLHWHITDDQSFPFVSTTYPELSAKGAYSSKHIYSPAAVQRVIEAGRLRGIRVILELDTPGHTFAMGKSYPELLTPCYGVPGEPGTALPGVHADRENLDPTKEFTYTFMRGLFTEIVQNVSKDSFVHLGMDEVYPPCWQSSPEIAAFMQANNYTSIHQVEEHYATRHIDMVKSLGATPISWQDPLDQGVELSKDVVIHMWKDWGGSWQSQLQNVLNKGYKAILSSPWYLNYINYGESWRGYYTADPILGLPDITPEQQKNILGGEACIWAEFVDKTNYVPRLLPFVGAIAERLWSSNIPIDDTAVVDARDRLDQFRCKLVQRGINAQPLLPGFCGSWEAYETENRFSSAATANYIIVPFVGVLLVIVSIIL